MDATVLAKAQMQAKRIYILLNEVLDVSCQLAEALDRDDQVTVRMLVSMRNEPVRKLQQARKALEEQRDSLPSGEKARLAELLNGAAPAVEEEKMLAGQVGANQRLLKQVLELDERINRKIAREKSIYR